MFTRFQWFIMGIAVVAVSGLAVADDHHHQHEGDVIVGQDGVSPAGLMFEAPVEEGHDHVHGHLEPNMILGGFSGDAPGFEALEADEPGEGFYTLGAGASIYLEIVSLASGLVLRDPSTGNIVGDSVGDQILLGDEAVHTHLIFHAAGASLGDEFPAEFRFVDLGTTGYDPSEAFEVHFEAVPEPASFTLLGAAGLLLRRRRD